ncbi:hypothetical protein D3C79_862150 [compost metagenome]
MAVHFQRIEVIVDPPIALPLTTEDPPLGFAVQPAQLIAHALQRGFHFTQRHLGIIDLLLDAPANDRMLTGQVAQVIQQV